MTRGSASEVCPIKSGRVRPWTRGVRREVRPMECGRSPSDLLRVIRGRSNGSGETWATALPKPSAALFAQVLLATNCTPARASLRDSLSLGGYALGFPPLAGRLASLVDSAPAGQMRRAAGCDFHKKSKGPGPGADFIFAAILPCFAKISAARSRQPFIPAASAPPEYERVEGLELDSVGGVGSSGATRVTRQLRTGRSPDARVTRPCHGVTSSV